MTTNVRVTEAKLLIGEQNAQQIADWLYSVDICLPKGKRVGDHLTLALFRASVGDTAQEAADKITKIGRVR